MPLFRKEELFSLVSVSPFITSPIVIVFAPVLIFLRLSTSDVFSFFSTSCGLSILGDVVAFVGVRVERGAVEDSVVRLSVVVSA